MASRDGNGWARCALGHRHWGRFGAAGLLAYVTGGPVVGSTVLLQRRAWWSHNGGTWGLPGGARDSHESALAAALREADEECGVPPAAVRPSAEFIDDHGGWSYVTVLAEADSPFAAHADHDEADEVRWVPAGEVTALDLHPGLAEHWAALAAQLSPLTVIVDSANVVGSRPDGWWRDRLGATLRLRDQLRQLGTAGLAALPDGPAAAVPVPGRAQISMRWLPDVVLVVEGAARPAAEAQAAEAPAAEEADPRAGGPGAGGAASHVQVVAAPGSGDDAIAEIAARTAGRRIVVTADRELRQRCVAAGAAVAGPAWLFGQL